MNGFFKNAKRTLTARLLLASILWALLVMVIGGAVLRQTFVGHVYDDLNETMESTLDALEGGVQVGLDNSIELLLPIGDQRFNEPASGWYYQIYDGENSALRSRSLWDSVLDTDSKTQHLRANRRFYPTDDGQRLYVLEQDLILPEVNRPYRFMVAVDVIPIDAKIRSYEYSLWIALALMGGLIVAAMWLQVAYGLRPLKRLQAAVADIRRGRARRLEGNWGADLEAAANEVNRLMAQNETTLERTRTYVGNLAHALKTPLAVIRNESGGLGPEAGDRISVQLDQLDADITRYLKRARIAGGGSPTGTRIKPRLRKIAKVVAKLQEDKGLVVDMDVDDDLVFAGEAEDFDEAMGNIIENAGKWAKTEIAVSARLDRDENRAMLVITVGDDGPGVPAGERETLFKRGARLDETTPGSGLGLAIVREIVDLSGGAVRLGVSSLGGLEVEIRLPAKV